MSRVPGLRAGWTQFLVTLGCFTLLAPVLWLAGLDDRWSLYAIAVLVAASAGLFLASEYRIASKRAASVNRVSSFAIDIAR